MPAYILWPTGLYLQAEVFAALNYRLYEFAKRSGCMTSTNQHKTSVANQRDYVLPSDAIDILHVAITSTDGELISLPNGSAFEVDFMLTDSETSTDVPTIYSIELGDVNSLSLLPPPSASGRVIHLIYTRKPNALSDVPEDVDMDIPDDFTPFVKYGALADLFMKAGEAYDPQRGQLCQQMFELGVEAVRGWVQGKQS